MATESFSRLTSCIIEKNIKCIFNGDGTWQRVLYFIHFCYQNVCRPRKGMTHIFLQHKTSNHFHINFRSGNYARTDSKREIPLHVSSLAP